MCGKEYETQNNGQNRFCSKHCKEKFRRNSGCDNEIRHCIICEKEFLVNKYSKTKTCSRACSIKLRSQKRTPKR